MYECRLACSIFVPRYLPNEDPNTMLLEKVTLIEPAAPLQYSRGFRTECLLSLCACLYSDWVSEIVMISRQSFQFIYINMSLSFYGRPWKEWGTWRGPVCFLEKRGSLNDRNSNYKHLLRRVIELNKAEKGLSTGHMKEVDVCTKTQHS